MHGRGIFELESPEGRGGGSSSFGNLGKKWGGLKIKPFGGGRGMDFCWNNPLSQTVLQEEMINQHNIILLQISTGYGYVSFWLSCNSSGSVQLPLAGITIIHIGSVLGVSVL